MSEPRTEAGRRALRTWIIGRGPEVYTKDDARDLIAAIEAEAAQRTAPLDNWQARDIDGRYIDETKAPEGAVPRAEGLLIADFIARLDRLQDQVESLPSHGRNGVGADLVSRSDVLAAIGHSRASRPSDERDTESEASHE